MANKTYRAASTLVADTNDVQAKRKWTPIGDIFNMDEARAAPAVAAGWLVDITPPPAPAPAPSPLAGPGSRREDAPEPATAPRGPQGPLSTKDVPR
jgi:hypothetical protein